MRNTFESIVNNLNFIFIRQYFDIVRYDGENFTLGNDLSEGLTNPTFKKFLLDNIDYSVHSFNLKFELEKYKNGLIRYQKYGRKDVCRLLNWEKDISSTLYGYRTSK